MQKINEINNKVLVLVQDIMKLAQKNNLEASKIRLEEIQKRVKYGKTFIIVCGEFKRGKSSFINALLEESKICPVDTDITTSIATQIQYSDKEEVTVYFEKESRKKPVIINREDISTYVTEQENKSNKQQVRSVSISVPNRFLKENSTVVVDTPGVGGLFTKHAEVTAAYLSVANVILFTCDATAPLTTYELDFIKKSYSFCKNIYFILTKIDLVDDWKIVEEENRKKISELLKISLNQVKIFPISNYNKLDYMEIGDEDYLKDSGFLQFEENLLKELNGNILKNEYLDYLKKITGDIEILKKPLMVELATCEQSKEKVKEIEQQLKDYQLKYKVLQESKAEWQIILNDEKHYINDKLSQWIDSHFVEIQTNLKKIIKDKNGYRTNTEKITEYINEQVTLLINDIEKSYKRELLKLENRLYETIGIEINSNKSRLVQVEKIDVGDFYNRDSKGISREIFDIGSKMFSTREILTFAVTVLATFSTISIPITVPLIGSIILGIKQSFDDNKKKQLDEMLNAALKVLDTYKKKCFDIFDINLMEATIGLRDSILQSMKEISKTYEKAIEDINANRNINAFELALKINKIQTQLNEIKPIEEQFGSILNEVQSL